MHNTPHLHAIKDSFLKNYLKNTLNFIYFLILYIINCECFLNLGSSKLLSKLCYYNNLLPSPL
jgi:hypothetical protein